MNYEQTLAYIHTINWRGSKLGLERIRELLRRMGDPQDKLRFVHVAGTNGKGSVSALTAAALQAAGYKTGLYISPFIRRFNERIQINGAPISDDALCETVEFVREYAESMPDLPTEFEIVCAVGFEYFLRQGCDVVVLETGLGGRLDATNVIGAPLVSVITPIGFDHMQQLGNTLAAIAGEKAGILKPGAPCVRSEQPEEAAAVIDGVCRERGCPLHVADFSAIESLRDSLDGQTFRYRGDIYDIRLLGAHQLRNAAVALEALDVLRGEGFELPKAAVARGFAAARWPARFEVLSRQPLCIVDGAHNPHGARAAVEAAKNYLAGRRITVVMGVLADKDYGEMIARINTIADKFIATQPDSPRALPAPELYKLLQGFEKPAMLFTDPQDAVRAALRGCGEDGAVLALGSLYMAGAVLDCFDNTEDAKP
ncbi:MAG: folylpolyglutamate synthase/dihydrofolate synthase family protein [Oscillospiraceae bacterium]|nr:folylpolyglutamate synthase/dihydrofolate synthase family protein [Oscillospiraceae bacterium]